MRDLSSMAKNSMWPTSQAGGNMIANPDEALTAPGSTPVDNLQDRLSPVREEPSVETGPVSDGNRHLETGDTDGGTADSWNRTWVNPAGESWSPRRSR